MSLFPSTQARRIVIAAITIFWVILITGLYYYIYKPFSISFIQSIGSSILDIVVLIIFTIVAGGLGRWIFSHLELEDWNRGERISADVLFGYATLSTLLLVVGIVKLNTLSVAFVLLGTALVTWSYLIAWVRDARKWVVGLKMSIHGMDRVAVIMIFLAVTTALIMSLLPPTKWDVLTYHLAGVQQYVANGRFYPVPNNHFLGFPQQVDTLFAAQFALSGQLSGSSLFQWAMGSFMLLLVGNMAARRFGLRAGLIAVSTIIVGKTIWLEMTYSYSDLLPMGLSAVGFNVIDAWAQSKGRRDVNKDGIKRDAIHIILIGMAAGFTMGTKYTTLGMAVAFGILILWISRHDHWRNVIKFALLYGFTASIVLSPWLVRNAVWYGNPVYPLFFNSSEMDSIRQEWYGDPGSGMIYTANAWQLPILPILATFLGIEGKEGFGTSIGPLYLLLCPLLILTWAKISPKERKISIRALIMIATIVAIWILATAFLSEVNQRTRYILYMFPILAILAGLALESLYRLPEKPIHLAFIVHAIVAMVLVFTGLDYFQEFLNSGFTTYFSGGSHSKEAFLEQKLGWHYEAMRQINALPQNSTVRFLWEPRYLYCDEDKINCYGDSLMDGWYYARRTIADGYPESIAQYWKKEEFDYFLVYEFGRTFEEERNRFYTTEDWEEWDSFVDKYLEDIWSGGSMQDIQYLIYQWKD